MVSLQFLHPLPFKRIHSPFSLYRQTPRNRHHATLNMPKYDKKRAADSNTSEPEVATKRLKNSAAGAGPDGKDDEGNPFWEV